MDEIELAERGYVHLGSENRTFSKEEKEYFKNKYGKFEIFEGVLYGLPKSKLESSVKK